MTDHPTSNPALPLTPWEEYMRKVDEALDLLPDMPPLDDLFPDMPTFAELLAELPEVNFDELLAELKSLANQEV
jgi:hypothetical protein